MANPMTNETETIKAFDKMLDTISPKKEREARDAWLGWLKGIHQRYMANPTKYADLRKAEAKERAKQRFIRGKFRRV